MAGFFTRIYSSAQATGAQIQTAKANKVGGGSFWDNIGSGISNLFDPKVLAGIGSAVIANQKPQQPSSGTITTQPIPNQVGQTPQPVFGMFPMASGDNGKMMQQMMPLILIGGVVVALVVVLRRK